jgi:hypothetical protein
MRNQKVNKYFFNMVEIILAIGVLAVGFAAVLGLFPVAVKMVKSTQTESVVSSMIGDLYSYYMSSATTPLMDRTDMTKQLEGEYWYRILFADSGPTNSKVNTSAQYQNTITNRSQFFPEGDIEKVREAVRKALKDGESNFLNGNHFLKKLKEKVENTITDGDDVQDKLSADADLKMLPNLNLFCPKLPSQSVVDPKFVMFYMIKGDADFSRIDTSAQVLVWKTYMKTWEDTTASNYNDGTVLNFEVSWPINLPYDEREIRYYQFLIINPKKISGST